MLDEQVIKRLTDLEVDPKRPLYEQYFSFIRGGIAKGTIEPGSKLPSIREFASHLRVNPTTVSKTYQALERANLIVTYRGQGTFVTEDEQAIEQCKSGIAVDAVKKLQETAQSIGLTLEDIISLAKKEGGIKG